VGAGSAEGAMDASNIIKPALARGELQCIGATTLNEYRKFIEKDAALERRFQTVPVANPRSTRPSRFSRACASRYEAHHRAKYTEPALEAAVRLTARYLSRDRFQLPDKAIDAIDEAGARAHQAPRVPRMREGPRDRLRITQQKEPGHPGPAFRGCGRIARRGAQKREEAGPGSEDWRGATTRRTLEVTEEDMRLCLENHGCSAQEDGRKRTLQTAGHGRELSKTVIGQTRGDRRSARPCAGRGPT
jgi:ATP-dependent Clp protease ATP-binding subunit ClpC